MNLIPKTFSVITLNLLISLTICVSVFAQSSDGFLGIKLRSEVQAIVKEIERKTGEEIYAEFIDQRDFLLGSSFITEEGVPVVLIDFSFEDNPKKLEAVIAHELLHLRLRVNNYPTFVFSPRVQTAKGRAIDTEQSNINSLKNMIEHQIFKAEMEKFGLYKLIDLAGDTAKQAKKEKGQENSQADSINYARAILEYQSLKDIEEVRKVYEENGWKRALQTGKAIADIISQAKLNTPKDAETVFLQCILKLYPPPRPTYTFKLTLDPKNKFFRRMIINTMTHSKRKN